MAADEEYVRDAMAAGFTREQAVFLAENIPGHTHDIEDVEGLPEVLEELGIEDEPDEGEA